MKLPQKYYWNEDVVHLAKDLLGKLLITQINGVTTGGIITETEAYSETERGSHAFNKRKTERTKIMFEKGGLSYVYFCYGMHHLFNVVTGKKDVAQAVLVRAIHPTIGIEDILQRRNKSKADKNLCNGPGKVCEALGITREQYGLELNGEVIWIERSKVRVDESKIDITPRIGIHYAGDDALLPWRFVLKI